MNRYIILFTIDVVSLLLQYFVKNYCNKTTEEYIFKQQNITLIFL